MSAIQEIHDNMIHYPERVRQAKDEQRYTNVQISDLSGVSLAVVGKLMAGSGADPKLYDAAAICRVLGLSLDELFDLDRPPDDPNEMIKRIHELELTNAEQAGRLEVLTTKSAGLCSRMRDQRSVIYILICACVVLSFALVGYLLVDLNIRDAGLIQWGQFSALACIIVVLILAAVMAIGWTIARVIWRK